MSKDKQYFLKMIEKQIKCSPKSSGYGDKVMPVLRAYKDLETHEEKKAFQDALELLLRDSDAIKRNFAVDVCLGFFVFRDAI